MSNPARAKIEDLQGMIDLASLVFKSEMGKTFPVLFSQENVENMTIVKEGGKLVSMIGLLPREISFFGHRVKVGLVGSVCTHPDYRGKNYGAVTLAKVEELAIDMGLSLLIISGGRGLYQRFGAVRPPGMKRILVKPGRTASMREARISDTGKILDLYRMKPLRYIRNFTDFEKTFSTGFAEARKAKTHLSEKAYITVVEREDNYYVIEYGGSSKDVISLTRGFIEKLGLKECIIVAERHFKAEESLPIEFPGTVKIISKRSFFDQMESYFTEIMPSEDYDRFMETVERLSLAEFNQEVFCCSKFRGLPLSLPNYGFDYI
ncbi:MAG: GNAT family N-acetyltransferase [Kosmotogaceae bacterium]|nr:GNAT family N-acetyltransferase [Kosmotogaceae bacterium]